MRLSGNIRTCVLKNKVVRDLSFLSTVLLWSILFVFFSYISYKGILGLMSYGFTNVFLSSSFSATGNSESSFWAPFGVTVILAIIVVLFSIPISLRCAIWSCFYCSKKYRKSIVTVLIILANLPSVVLGLFVRNYFASFLNKLIPFNNSLNLITASIALVFMILPITTSLFISVLEDKKAYVISSEVLGLDKNYSIYKILVPKIKHTIIIAVTVVIGRVLSESIMLSMLLSSENYSKGYTSGIKEFFGSQLNPVAALISENFFSDGSTEDIQSLMFLFGALLLITTLIVSNLGHVWIKRDKNKVRSGSQLLFVSKYKSIIKWYIYSKIWDYCRDLDAGKIGVDDFIFRRSLNKRFRRILGSLRRLLEFFSIAVFITFVLSLFCTSVAGGIISLLKKKEYDIGQDSLLRAILNTFVIVFLSVFTAAPIALLTSIYLTEYSKENLFKKYTLAIINTASATPSVIYGIFGLSLFINTLGWTSNGTSGKSLIAGILTITLLILPFLTHLFFTHISSVADYYREASYILGIGKYKTFTKVVIPLAASNLIFSLLLTIGKIIGETAPLYLTAGLNSTSTTLLMYPGQTLTTRIYSQLLESSINKKDIVTKETTFCCLLMISILIIAGRHGSNVVERIKAYLRKKYV